MRIPALVVIVAMVVGSGCAIVPKNRRRYLADPTMQPDEDVLRHRAHAKIHTAREGAAGTWGGYRIDAPNRSGSGNDMAQPTCCSDSWRLHPSRASRGDIPRVDQVAVVAMLGTSPRCHCSETQADRT